MSHSDRLEIDMVEYLVIGAGVVGGMVVGTLALIFLVPTLFIIFQTIQEKVVKPKKVEK